MIPSIERRLLVSSTIILAGFLGLGGVALDQANREAAEDAARERLEAHVFSLLAAAGTDDAGRMRMPTQLAAPDFNRPGSGLYAEVLGEQDGYRWRSGSLLGERPVSPAGRAPGERAFAIRDGRAAYELGIDWEDDAGEPVRYTLGVALDMAPLDRQRTEFRNTLWRWLGGAALLLLLAQLVLLRWGLRPLLQMSEAVRRLEQGEARRIEGPVARELQGLGENLNALIALNERRQARVRHSLADLAHSMKTPLTVLRGVAERLQDTDSRRLVDEQTRRIDQLLNYQRQRAAVAGRSGVTRPISPLPVLQRLCESLHKVHRERDIDCVLSVDSSDHLRADEGDLFELFGNLLENAFKHCVRDIRVTIRQRATDSHICIEDDGPGIDAADAERLLQRGERADQRHPGEGIGLAVVDEIVRQYGGTLEIGRSALGGAALRIRLPR